MTATAVPATSPTLSAANSLPVCRACPAFAVHPSFLAQTPLLGSALAAHTTAARAAAATTGGASEAPGVSSEARGAPFDALLPSEAALASLPPGVLPAGSPAAALASGASGPVAWLGAAGDVHRPTPRRTCPAHGRRGCSGQP